MISLISPALICAMPSPFQQLLSHPPQLGSERAVVNRAADLGHHPAHDIGINPRFQIDLLPDRHPQTGPESLKRRLRQRRGGGYRRLRPVEPLVYEPLIREDDLRKMEEPSLLQDQAKEVGAERLDLRPLRQGLEDAPF